MKEGNISGKRMDERKRRMNEGRKRKGEFKKGNISKERIVKRKRQTKEGKKRKGESKEE